MASKTSTTLALFLAINLILFNLGSGATALTCSRGDLKISLCANVLNLANLKLGSETLHPCCSLISGLVDLEAGVCLCTSLKLSVLGINLSTPINLGLALNACGRSPPRGFQCPV